MPLTTEDLSANETPLSAPVASTTDSQNALESDALIAHLRQVAIKSKTIKEMANTLNINFNVLPRYLASLHTSFLELKFTESFAEISAQILNRDVTIAKFAKSKNISPKAFEYYLLLNGTSYLELTLRNKPLNELVKFISSCTNNNVVLSHYRTGLDVINNLLFKIFKRDLGDLKYKLSTMAKEDLATLCSLDLGTVGNPSPDLLDLLEQKPRNPKPVTSVAIPNITVATGAGFFAPVTKRAMEHENNQSGKKLKVTPPDAPIVSNTAPEMAFFAPEITSEEEAALQDLNEDILKYYA